MSAGSALIVHPDITIPRSELSFRASRAGGPGGQHVNTSSTRVELLWNPERSRGVSSELKEWLREKLASRLDGQGNVRVVASAFRSQARNRADAEDKLATLIRRALVVRKPRRKTRPHRGAIESRLVSKKKRSEKKRERRTSDDE